MSISDVLKLSRRSNQRDKNLFEFMSGILMRGLTPSTSLALIVDELAISDGGTCDNESKTLFSRMTMWLQSTVFGDQLPLTRSSLFIQSSFESLLLDEVKKIGCFKTSSSLLNSASQPGWHRSTPIHNANNADSQTISTCIKHLYNLSSMYWSRMEVDFSNRALIKLREWTESMERELRKCSSILTHKCHKTLVEASALAISTSSHAQSKLHKRRLLNAKINAEKSLLLFLEEQLALEVNLLEQTKRVERYLEAHLSMERCSPISALTEEIRALILPNPIMASIGTDFTFSLLDNAAEIVLKLPMNANSDDEHEGTSIASGDSGRISGNATTGLELGCFIKDSGTSSIKMLRAILFGNMEMRVDDDYFGPYILRESLSLFILEDGKSRVEVLHQLSHTVSRIDSIVRSVRDLEMEEDCICNVIPSTNEKDVSLFISMPYEKGEIQVLFSFINLLGDNWHVSPIWFFPNVVKVTIVSSTMADEEKSMASSLSRQMQEKAQAMNVSMMNSSSADPVLLKRICKEMKRMV